MQEIDRAITDGLDGCRNVDAAADEHNRQVDPHLAQTRLQRESIHARQAQVQHQAATPSIVKGSQELERRAEHGGRKPDRDDQLAYRVAASFVVVNDEYGVFAHGHKLEAVQTERWCASGPSGFGQKRLQPNPGVRSWKLPFGAVLPLLLKSTESDRPGEFAISAFM